MSRPRNLTEAARLDGGAGSVSTKRQRLAADIASASQAETPYGQLVKTLDIQDFKLPYICPFALLWQLTQVSAGYAALLQSRIGDALGRVVLYVDEVIPGNNLRPDHARAFYSVFWLFLDYPDWLRSSAFGWHDLIVIKASVCEEIRGGISAVVACLLRVFWGTASGAYNMQTLGVRVASPRGDRVLRAEFCVFLVDERAEKFITGAKGSSGSKMCLSCRNVVGRIDPASVRPPFRHFSIPGLDGCEPQTVATFNADLEYLRSQHGAVTATEFKGMQQALGIAFDLNSLPYSDMRGYARIPESRFCDWMHNLCASGGVVQYQVNQFCLALRTSGLSLQSLDDFQQRCRLPHCQSQLKKSFFKDRVATTDVAHIKAFAGEILSIICVLHLFSDIVLAPIGVMGAHVSLARLISRILQILRLGDGAVQHVAALQRLALQFHTEFLVAAPQCVKPKLHYMHHTGQQIARHAANLSCFAPERKHQANKQALNYIFRNMEVALAVRNVDSMLRLAQQAETFKPTRLDGTLKILKVTASCFDLISRRFGDESARAAQTALGARTPRGSLYHKDLIMWMEGGHLAFGKVLTFVQIGETRVAAADVYEQRGGQHVNTHASTLVDLADVRGAVIYFEHDNGSITPFVPEFV